MYTFIIIITNLIGLIPLGIYYGNIRKLSKETILILPFFWIVAIASFYEIVFTVLLKINSTYWFRTYLILEFLCLFYIFKNIFLNKYNRLLHFFVVTYLVLFFYSIFKWNEVHNLVGDSYLSIFEALFVFLFSILWFKDIFQNLKYKSLWDSQLFFFYSGLILYFSGTLFLFVLSENFIEAEVGIYDFWMLNIVFNIIFRLILIITVWKGRVK